MIRNLKMLGLSLVAICALGAVAASAASANANYWFTAPSPSGDWTVLSGSQPKTFNDEFRVVGITGGTKGILKCETAAYTGSTGATTMTTINLAPGYGNCELQPWGKATTTMNGCEYVIHTNQSGDTTNGSYDTVTTIDCTAGKEITIEVKIAGILKCVVHIEPQNLGAGLVLSNNTGGGLSAIVNFTTNKYTQTEGTGANKCSGEATRTDGVWLGSATITGKNTAGAAVAINAST